MSKLFLVSVTKKLDHLTDILDITEAEKAAQAIGYEWSEDADEDVYS